MSARRFQWALRSRGCTIADWPSAERDPALRLLRRSPAARLLLADAMALDQDSEADGAALARMQGVVHRALAPPTPVLRCMRWGAIAACAVAGLYLGLPAVEPDFAAAILGPTMQVDSPAVLLAELD